MKNKKLIIVIVVLLLIIAVLGYINAKEMNARTGDEGNVAFVEGDKAITLSYEDIVSLNSKEFRATEDTSTSGPTPRKYKGVLLKDAINLAGFNDDTIAGYKKIVVTGLDGYVIALSTEEILGRKNVYLAYEKDGKPLGTMRKGGSGPFQMIATADMFAQRWCKYVIEVRLE